MTMRLQIRPGDADAYEVWLLEGGEEVGRICHGIRSLPEARELARAAREALALAATRWGTEIATAVEEAR